MKYVQLPFYTYFIESGNSNKRTIAGKYLLLNFLIFRTITSLSDLSSAIIEEIDPEIATSLFVDIRVDALSGEILIISRAHVAQQRAKGLLLCKLCGRFYSGEKGLRHHQQIKVLSNNRNDWS